jgi:glycosyltransferase involved in cell wall biosynthesis
VVLISNAVRTDSFHPAVKHVAIGYQFTEKRGFQALISILPARSVVKKYAGLFDHLTLAIGRAGAAGSLVYFFDYLDNSIGYVLKKTGKIAGYVNDVHGIAPIEFTSNARLASGAFLRGWYRLKASLADRLDKKVFEYGDGFLFGSHPMQEHFHKRYCIRGRSIVLPYLLDEKALDQLPDNGQVERLKKQFGLSENDFVFMFVGTFKATAGVEDLLTAFSRLRSENRDAKLILIGDGMTRRHCEQMAAPHIAEGAVLFVDPVPYDTLPDYFALANVIVCPDRDNTFSQLIVHIKYLDALASGRLVINGRFRSVAALNEGRPLSLLFTPSDRESLYLVMKDSADRYDEHCDTYRFARTYVREHLTYDACIPALAKLNASLG